jgi:hypothetical protein
MNHASILNAQGAGTTKRAAALSTVDARAAETETLAKEAAVAVGMKHDEPGG